MALWSIWAYASGVVEAYRGETLEVIECYLDHQITFSECVLLRLAPVGFFALEEALARLERRELLREFDSVERKLPAQVPKRSGTDQVNAYLSAKVLPPNPLMRDALTAPFL